MKRLHKLKKCCGQYPSPRIRVSDGAKRLVCEKCGKSTHYYKSASLSANLEWNEMKGENADH